MTYLYLLLIVNKSSALQHTLPSNFGGKSDFSDRGWRELIGQLSPEVKFGQAPTTEISTGEEHTCFGQFSKCSTSYFGKLLALKQPDSAKLWVKWHRDATPFACNSPDGCIITSARSVADLSSQSRGWSVTASLDADAGTNRDSPTINGKSNAQLSILYSQAPITPKTMVSTRSLISTCLNDHMCYIQTGTLMMTISGECDSKPLIVCDRHYYVCEEFNYPRTKKCPQWDKFTWKNCERGDYTPGKQQCSINVAVTGENGEPISFQVFEQKPIPGKRKIAKLDFSSTESPFGELPDGSSGAWMAWSSKAQ